MASLLEESLAQFDDVTDFLPAFNSMPRFKNGLDLNTLLTTNKVTFELDGDGQILEPDDETLYLDDEEEATATGPVDHIGGRGPARGIKTGRSFSFGCDTSFDMFQDPDCLKEMINVEETGGIIKTIVKEGGSLVPLNSKVYIHYSCFVDPTGDPYDTTVANGVPLAIDFRSCDGIPGMLLAVKSMKVGEISKFLIRSNFAFGKVGCPPRIPAAADIMCIIQVVYFLSEEQLKSVIYMTGEERAALEFKEIMNAAKDQRRDGNCMYKDGKYWRAIKKYRKAIDILEEYPLVGAEDAGLREDFLFTLYSNVAQCYIKVERPQQACIASRVALRSQDGQSASSCAKAFYRFAEAKIMLGNYEHAVPLNKEALRRLPDNSSIKKQKTTIIKKIKEGRAMEKVLYEKMGRGLSVPDKDISKQLEKPASSATKA